MRLLSIDAIGGWKVRSAIRLVNGNVLGGGNITDGNR